MRCVAAAASVATLLPTAPEGARCALCAGEHWAEKHDCPVEGCTAEKG